MVLPGDSREGTGDFRLSMSLSHRLRKQVGEGFVAYVPSFLWNSQKWPNKLLQGKVSVLLARLLLPGELVALASAHQPADIVPLGRDWNGLGPNWAGTLVSIRHVPPGGPWTWGERTPERSTGRGGDCGSFPIPGRGGGSQFWPGETFWLARKCEEITDAAQ